MKQKKLIVFLAIIVISVTWSCQQGDIVNISGHIQNGKGKNIVIHEDPQTRKGIYEKIMINRKDKFSYRFKTNKTVFIRLVHLEKPILLIVNPGDQITINATSALFHIDYEVKGSEESKKIKTLNDRLYTMVAKADSLNTQASEATNPGIEKTAMLQLDSLLKEHKKFLIGFMLSDLASLANIVALHQEYNENFFFNSARDVQFYKLVNDSLSVKHPGLAHVETLKQTTSRLIQEVQLMTMLSNTEKVTVGLPRISLPDAHNKVVSLFQLKAPYALLLFGSSVSKESIAAYRQLMPIYKTYRDKGFEIYNVSIENNFNNWLNHIKFEELPWVSVCDTSGSGSIALNQYNVEKLPASFLIDLKNLEILGKDLSPRQLDIKLNNLINNP